MWVAGKVVSVGCELINEDKEKEDKIKQRKILFCFIPNINYWFCRLLFFKPFYLANY
jgi:hypothetical protein